MAKLNLKEEHKKEVLTIIKQRANKARNSGSNDFERFGRYYKLFRGIQQKRNYQGLADLFVPEPYRIVRKKTAKLSNAIHKIKSNPVGRTDVQNSRIATNLLNWLRRKLKWFLIERTAIQESRITGLSWVKCVWLLSKEEKDKPYKGFDLSFAPADEVLVDPDASIIDVFEGNFKYLIHEYSVDLETLKRNPNYDDSAVAFLERQGNKSSGLNEASPLEQSRFSFLDRVEGKDNQQKSHKITEYWGKFIKDKKEGEKDYLIVVANSNVILRFEENPYADILDRKIPFVPFVVNPIGKELFPVGDIEPAEKLFYELNDTRNQRMDTVTFNIDPPKEVLRGAKINENELMPRRGWFFKSNIPGGVRFIHPSMEGVRAAIDEEQVIRGDIQQVTGVLDFTQSSEVQAGVNIDTASGTIIAKGEADVQVEDELRILKISLAILYNIVLSFAQNFLDRKFTIRILEEGVEQFHDVSKKDIGGNFDIDVEMRTLQDRTTDQQLKLLMLNLAKSVPGTKVGKFFVDVLESFYDDVNISEYYEEPQPVGPEPPKVSISLKGDLNPLEVDEIYKTITGVDPSAADPLVREEFKKQMMNDDEFKNFMTRKAMEKRVENGENPFETTPEI